jgi:hypothetical protein
MVALLLIGNTKNYADLLCSDLTRGRFVALPEGIDASGGLFALPDRQGSPLCSPLFVRTISGRALWSGDLG